MVATIPLNPTLTSNAAGSFGVSWDGLIQGTVMPDPSTRFAEAGGILASTETIPMWGGVGIYEDVPPAVSSPSPGTPFALGGNVGRAVSLLSTTKGLTGFSSFNQAYGMINSPESPVPLAASGMQVMFWRLGSGARIAVAMAPSLISLEGGLITAQVSWDFVAQQLVPYTPAYANTTITNAVWAATAGGQTTFTVGTDLSAILAAGSIIDVSGVVSTGGTGAGFNGTWIVVSVTSTTIVVTQAAASSPGTYSSGGTVAGAGGALPCKILRTYNSGCMTVQGPDANGNYTWNRNGSCALIVI